MFVPPEPSLEELQEDAAAIETLLEAGVLDIPSQVIMHTHLTGLRRSINFIERMGC